MPPQIKQDLNRSGWETTNMPSVCEKCYPDNPLVQVLQEDYGAECKLCTRPFTVFFWKADRTAKQKRTGICLTCARLKNCCQCCMLDLSFGLPITIRDAALKMVAPGPQSGINREYYAQNNEREIEEGRGLEGYDKTDEKARDLLRRLANSEPHWKKQRRLDAEAAEATESGQKLLESGQSSTGGQNLLEGSGGSASGHSVGPIRTSDSKPKSQYGSAYARPPKAGTSSGGNRGGARVSKGFPSAAALPPQPKDILPPADKNIVSLFVTGVEDDLPQHDIQTYFAQFGALKSVVCSHRAHCAFINYMDRKGAETAAEACQGRAAVKGVPLRVGWGRPKPLDNMDRDQRMANAKAGRATASAAQRTADPQSSRAMAASSASGDFDSLLVAPPPGQGDVEYAAMAGD